MLLHRCEEHRARIPPEVKARDCTAKRRMDRVEIGEQIQDGRSQEPCLV